jgi:hypothetical protein
MSMSRNDSTHTSASASEDLELAEEMAAVRALVGAPATSGARAIPSMTGELESLQAQVQARIAADKGPLGRLRSLPTRTRLFAVCATFTALVGAAFLFLPHRQDLSAYPMWRMILTLSSFGILAAAASWRVLRPIHLPPANPRIGMALLALGLGVPCAMAIIPLHHEGVAAGVGAQFALECTRCAGFGAVMGMPGLTGNLVLQLHCPNTDVWHQLLGHWVVLLILPVATAVWAARRANA